MLPVMSDMSICSIVLLINMVTNYAFYQALSTVSLCDFSAGNRKLCNIKSVNLIEDMVCGHFLVEHFKDILLSVHTLAVEVIGGTFSSNL